MPSVLVTGASRGIGRAIVSRLAANGWDVVAGVRTAQDAATITAMHPRITTVLLDVTDAAALAALHDSLPDRLDAVVNNAGIFLPGPIEAAGALTQLQSQLEVNLIGAMAVTQTVMPRLRRSGGRVVFVSSVNGRVSFPLLGTYSASKFALEAAADALRMELKPWKIRVVIVQPGETDTDIWHTIEAQLAESTSVMTSQQRDLYARHMTGLAKMVPLGRKLTAPPEHVAVVVGKALTARRPRARYAVGLGTQLQLAMLKKLPVRVRDALLRAMFRQPVRNHPSRAHIANA